MVASALVVAAFMVLLQMPGAASAVLLPLLALLWATCFPLAVMVQVRRQREEAAARQGEGLWGLALPFLWLPVPSPAPPAVGAGGRQWWRRCLRWLPPIGGAECLPPRVLRPAPG